MDTPILETERVILRPLSVDDAEIIYARWTSDDRVSKYVRWSTHESAEITRQWLTFVENNNASEVEYQWGFVRKEDGYLFGCGGIHYNQEESAYELGYNIMYDFWNQGYTTEIAKRILLFAQEELGQTEFVAWHAVDNPASGKVLRKCGFMYETNEIHEKFDGSVQYDTMKYRKKKIELSDYPILEFDDGGLPIVDPEKFLTSDSLESDKLVITFFPEVIEKLKSEGKIHLVRVLGGENPLDIYQFVNSDVYLVRENVGCPACAGDLECFYALGIRRVMFCGGGGVLDKTIGVGTLLVVEGAIRDEGFSFQYLPPSRVIYANKAVNRKITEYLTKENIPYIEGLTWTTDAMFRETPRRIERRKAEGAKIVEMEQSGCIAVSQYKNFSYGTIIYGGDDVSGLEWDSRNWNSREGIRYDLVQLCKQIVETL